jgi:thiol-disulfide isomerase/thioredoxin
VLAALEATWLFSDDWHVSASLRLPVYTHVEGGQLDVTGFAGVSFGTHFHLFDGGAHAHAHDHEHGKRADWAGLDKLDLTDRGEAVDLVPVVGKITVFDFWATWCEPCKIEMPWLVEYNKQYGPQGFTVLGVAMDDDADSKAWVQKDIRKFSDEMKVNYPVLLGTSKIGDTYGGVPFLPEIFYIGRDGKIVEHAIGLKGKGEIEENIKKIL